MNEKQKRPSEVVVGDRIVQSGYNLGSGGITDVVLTVTGIEEVQRGSRLKPYTAYKFAFDRRPLFSVYREEWSVELAD